MRRPILSLVLLATFAATIAGCSSSTSPSSTSTSTTTVNPTTELLSGTVAALVNGERQSSSNPFTVALNGGGVTVTLTSAVETFPDGSLLPTVTMGLGVGTWANNTCTQITNAYTTAQAGGTPQLSGTINSGAYCVLVSDVTNQLGPVAYAVSVSHY